MVKCVSYITFVMYSICIFICKCSLIYRYVLARFNERFAKEYKQEPAKIPEEWKKITKEEALYSLNEVVTGQC